MLLNYVLPSVVVVLMILSPCCCTSELVFVIVSVKMKRAEMENEIQDAERGKHDFLSFVKIFFINSHKYKSKKKKCVKQRAN